MLNQKLLSIMLLCLAHSSFASYSQLSQIQCAAQTSNIFCNFDNLPLNVNSTAQNAQGYCCSEFETNRLCFDDDTDGRTCTPGLKTQNQQVYFAYMIGVTDEVCQVENRQFVATSEPQTFTATQPTFSATKQTYHPSCWYTITTEDYIWVNNESKIKLTINEVSPTAQVSLFKGTSLTNITTYVQNNGTVIPGAPYYFDLRDPPFIIIGHEKNQIPGSFSFTYQVIGQHYNWWIMPYLSPDEEWKWQAIRWGVIISPAFLLICCICTFCCCKKCKCCKKNKKIQNFDSNQIQPLANTEQSVQNSQGDNQDKLQDNDLELKDLDDQKSSDQPITVDSAKHTIV